MRVEKSVNLSGGEENKDEVDFERNENAVNRAEDPAKAREQFLSCSTH